MDHTAAAVPRPLYPDRFFPHFQQISPGCCADIFRQGAKCRILQGLGRGSMNRRCVRLMLAGVAIALGAATGCQTWTSGMTLPSGRYLEHSPQYFPPSPAFPLTSEPATIERQ